MIIYIDVVIILNIFLDFLLLMSVSVILTRNVRFYRIIIGSIIGGGTTFLLFINAKAPGNLLFLLLSLYKITNNCSNPLGKTKFPSI